MKISVPEAALLLTWSSDDAQYDFRDGLMLCLRLGLILGLRWLLVFLTPTFLPLLVRLRLFLKSKMIRLEMQPEKYFERNCWFSKNGLCIFTHLPECLWIDFRLFIVNVRLIWWYGSVISDVISWIVSGEPIADGPYPSSARASKHGWIFRNHIVRWDGWIWFIWWGVTRRIGRAMFDVFTGWILSNGSAIQITMARATPRKLRCSWGYRRGRRSYRA